MTGTAPGSADVVVVGAGMVGACCARWLARAGLDVVVVDRAGPVAGTTGAGEGNILVSDKDPGPELDLARRSAELWAELAAALPDDVEYERKGGLVVVGSEPALRDLHALAAAHAAADVRVEQLDPPALAEAEPLLAPELAGGVRWPDDAQVQPMLAAAACLADARRAGARACWPAEVQGPILDGDRVAGVATTAGPVSAGAVVNAAGPWAGELAERLGSRLAVAPRRGHVLVTEPLPPVVRHKVYEGDYMATVATGTPSLVGSPVVEGTAAGTVLIGSTRELVGWDRTTSTAALAELARRTLSLFPALAGVRVQRSYLGFRPASPDRMPLIGWDPARPGLLHATGHEGAGIGLAPATAEMVTALVTASHPPVDPTPFSPTRTFTDAPPEMDRG
jgi:D-hydroxyproline dehydrogenase subunit beta